MRRKLYKSRRGQISTEIMYAVGVMIMIFLLLTGISFNRRGELRKMDDYLQKRNECLKISNAIASLTSSGFNTRKIITPQYPVQVLSNGRIVVDPSTTSAKETPCTYVGAVNDTNRLLDAGQPYCFYTLNEKVYIFHSTTDPVLWSVCCAGDLLIQFCKV